MPASLFGVGGTVNVNVNGTVVPQSFVGIAAQTAFVLTNFTYTPGTNSLLVFINGQRQIVGRDFVETSSSTFSLIEGVDEGDFVDVLGFPAVDLVAVDSGSVSLGNSFSLQQYINDYLLDVRAPPFGAVGNGSTDDTVAFQTAINAGSIYVPGGYTYKLTGDILIPSNRKIYVEKGATIINNGGRFTSYGTVNVEFHIDGWIKSVGMLAAPDKIGWYVGERGFIEFGMAYVAGQASSGFWVHGTGIVSGDWTGTPNVSDLANQINYKGIASWNSCNVLVEGLEVYGFQGEAIYAYFFDTASHSIIFRNNNVHDTRFNALNFNSGAQGGNCSIHGNRVKNAYSLEISAGECYDNYIESTASLGIWTGLGTGYGPLVIEDNVIKNAGLHGIGAVFASGSPVTDITIQNNIIVNPFAYGIYTDYCRELVIRGNTCIGTGQGQGSYDIGLNHILRGVVSDNTFLSPGASAQTGRIAIDANSFDVDISATNNIYKATTGTDLPTVNGGVQTIASAATVTLPPLGKLFSVSGTTDITSISATNCNGREITLIFQGILTFTDGSNLKLAGNLVTTADDTISLVCDGTNWYETGRSVN